MNTYKTYKLKSIFSMQVSEYQTSNSESLDLSNCPEFLEISKKIKWEKVRRIVLSSNIEK